MNDKTQSQLLEILRDEGAYEVLSITAEWMKDELVPAHGKRGRPDLVGKFLGHYQKLANLADAILFDR